MERVGVPGHQPEPLLLRESPPRAVPLPVVSHHVLLEGAKVATVPGMVFGPEGEGHLRFSFSVAEDMIAGGVEALTAFAGKELQAR